MELWETDRRTMYGRPLFNQNDDLDTELAIISNCIQGRVESSKVGIYQQLNSSISAALVENQSKYKSFIEFLNIKQRLKSVADKLYSVD